MVVVVVAAAAATVATCPSLATTLILPASSVPKRTPFSAVVFSFDFDFGAAASSLVIALGLRSCTFCDVHNVEVGVVVGV